MKKTLLLFAAAMMSAATFAQSTVIDGITVTNVGEEGENNTFKLPADSKVYDFLTAGDETLTLLGINKEDASSYVYCGPDEANGRNLDNWTYTAGDGTEDASSEFNSYGVLGECFKFVSNTSWSGWALNVSPDHPIDLSGITNEYILHLAVKSTKHTGGDFIIEIHDNDGTADHPAKLDLSKLIQTDGNWYSIDVPVSTLNDDYGLDFSTSKTFSRPGGLFVLLFGEQGNNLYIDDIFFYGPKTTTGISNVTASEDANAPVEYYTVSGQRVSKAQAVNGVYIKKQGSTTTKVVMK